MTEADLAAVISRLPGWCTPEKAHALYELVLTSDAQRTVELGVFGGRSLIPLALAHRSKGSGYVVGIDPWEMQPALEGVAEPENRAWWSALEYEPIYRAFVSAMLDLDLTYVGRWVRAASDEAVAMFADESIDLLHQDSNHSELVSCREATRWAPKVRPGGTWIIDDTDWASTRAVQALMPGLGFRETRDEGTWKVYQKR